MARDEAPTDLTRERGIRAGARRLAAAGVTGDTLAAARQLQATLDAWWQTGDRKAFQAERLIDGTVALDGELLGRADLNLPHPEADPDGLGILGTDPPIVLPAAARHDLSTVLIARGDQATLAAVAERLRPETRETLLGFALARVVDGDMNELREQGLVVYPLITEGE